jgi:hypothetical protein
MIWQNTPRINLITRRFQNLQKPFGKTLEPSGMQSDDVTVLVAGGRQEVTSTLAFMVLRAVPRTAVKAAIFQQFFPLLFIEFSPEIHGLTVSIVSPRQNKLKLELQLIPLSAP